MQSEETNNAHIEASASEENQNQNKEETKKPSVTGVAYSGGKMRLGGWSHPVVVDLSGMSIPQSVPLLADHENHTSSRVGIVKASISDSGLVIEGEIPTSSSTIDPIVAQGKAGAAWQLSIGAEVEKAEFVQKGTRTINCQEHEAPFYHVTKSTLREVSVVAVGADKQTHMQVTAAFKLTGETNIMDNKEELNKPSPEEIAAEASKAERERVVAIKKICGGEFSDIEAKAISEGWDETKTTSEVLAAFRAKQPTTGVNISVKSNGTSKDTLEAAMCVRAGINEDVVAKDYGETATETAMKDRDLPLKGLMAECMKIEGMDAPRSFDNTAIQAAFSTVSLPGILSNVANKKLLQAYQSQPIIATKLCTTGDLNDFKEADRFRLTDMGDLLPVAADGEIKDGGVVEEHASNQIDTYAKKFCLTRKMVINDDLGAFLKVPTAMGNRAARLVDQLFFKRLLANPVQGDGKALFSTAHKNLLSGATSNLSAESLRKAIQLFLDQVDAEGEPIAVEPKYLVVPTALKHLAIELTRGATLVMSGGTENTIRPAINVLADENLDVVSSPYLANAKYAGGSEYSWYLFGQPGVVDTFEIGYLKGKRTPTVERGETDFNTLGIWYRVFFDIGVREQDHRGIVKAAGTAPTSN